jgi:hypothetical protein
MITIVSGLPRSGTSLMMQMIAAGGLPVLSDGERKADDDNPRGYYEWERIKQLPKEPGIIAEAEGKVVKVISQLLPSLPGGYDYRIIFMERPLQEVLQSQDKMLVRRGNDKQVGNALKIRKAFERHLVDINNRFARRTDIAVLQMQYHSVLHEPQTAAETIAGFLKVPLNIEAMTEQVDASLYRNRVG